MFDMNSINTTCISCFKQHAQSINPCPDCGFDESTAEQAPHLLRARTILNGKYLVGKVLGQGGFGITYVGLDINLGLRIALKEYYPSGFVTRETTSTSAATVQPFTGSEGDFFLKGRDKFINEARALAKFFSLPGIVSVKDYFLENGTAYISMEFIDGQTLKDYVANMGGRLPAAQVFDLMKPVMSSLAEVHKNGIIHRDISPDNIMISKEGYLKLLDFGAARDFTGVDAKSMSVMLKPGFAPEEQYRTKGEQGPWTDIYALSATMYRCITGVTPEESIERVRKDNVAMPSAMGIAIDPKQENAMMMGMAVLQDKRFQSVPAIYAAMYGTKLSQSSLPATTTAGQQQNMQPAQNVQAPATSIPQQYGTPLPSQMAVPSQVGVQTHGQQPQYTQMPPQGPPLPYTPTPVKSGSWFSNNKVAAGILGGVILLVLALGIVFLVMFLPGSNGGANVSVTPTPTHTDTPSPTPNTPPPSVSDDINNTTWDLFEVYAEGVTLNKEYLDSIGLNATFWFDSSGETALQFEDEFSYGTWQMSGDNTLVYMDLDVLTLTFDGDFFVWDFEGVGLLTFIKNNNVMFNLPDRWANTPPPPDINDDDDIRENHFLKGLWWFADGFWLYHFGTSEKIIFFGNGDVYSEEDEEWATWHIIEEGRDKDTIMVVTDWGYEQIFTVYVDDYNRLTIEDRDGDRAFYDRGAYDSPVGEWTYYDTSNAIYFYGTSRFISFDVFGNTYGSDYDSWGYWWMEDFFTLVVYDQYNDFTHNFWFGTYGDFLTIYDEDGDYVIFRRAT